MKKIITIGLITISQLCFSQVEQVADTLNVIPVESHEEVTNTDINKVTNKNLIKLNLLALAVGNFSLQYERLITKKTVVALSAGFTPERGIPFYSSFESAIDNQDTKDQLKGIKYSNYSITPEIRFYLGKEGFKGFYIGVFGRYTSYDVKFPLQYESVLSGIPNIPGQYIPKESIGLDGNIRAFSGGITLGAQWKLSNKIYLDWLIIGPHFGSSKGDLKANKKLTVIEQQEINDAISDLDIPMLDYTYEVNSDGARMKFDGPWAGVRTSLGIGYRF